MMKSAANRMHISHACLIIWQQAAHMPDFLALL
jgi:hypothetical protein